MKTNDVERKTGLSKQTIHFYEKEGLINPSRTENNYRDYSEEDVQKLITIKLFRQMGISIDDIALIFAGKLPLQECFELQETYTKQSIEALEEAKDTINYYKDRHLPIIPELTELHEKHVQPYLGLKRYNEEPSLGRRLTKKAIYKKLAFWTFISTLLAYMATDDLEHPFIPFMLIAMFIFGFFEAWFAAGLGQFGTHNATSFMSFFEDSIAYYDEKQMGRIAFAKEILKGHDPLHYVKYEDIAKVKCVELRVNEDWENAVQRGRMFSYYFYFKDGTEKDMIRQLILDNDRLIINKILEEKGIPLEYIVNSLVPKYNPNQSSK